MRGKVNFKEGELALQGEERFVLGVPSVSHLIERKKNASLSSFVDSLRKELDVHALTRPQEPRAAERWLHNRISYAMRQNRLFYSSLRLSECQSGYFYMSPLDNPSIMGGLRSRRFHTRLMMVSYKTVRWGNQGKPVEVEALTMGTVNDVSTTGERYSLLVPGERTQEVKHLRFERTTKAGFPANEVLRSEGSGLHHLEFVFTPKRRGVTLRWRLIAGDSEAAAGPWRPRDKSRPRLPRSQRVAV